MLEILMDLALPQAIRRGAAIEFRVIKDDWERQSSLFPKRAPGGLRL